jgi:hypothetical protein
MVNTLQFMIHYAIKRYFFSKGTLKGIRQVFQSTYKE